MKKLLSITLILVLCLGIVFSVACSGANNGEKAKATIKLIDKDDKEYTYDVSFDDGATLRNILFENELISEEQFGSYFVEDIDGHIADVENDGCTWVALDAKGNMITGTFDDITMHDGETLTLQYYVVPNFDD